jgi:phage gp36-like protein
MFASRADLLARSNAMRLAQLAVPADHDFPECDKALRKVIEGGSLSGYSAKDRAALTLALDAIDKCLADADALLISYGIPQTAQTTILARLASTVALYYLQGAEHMTEEVEKAYKEVLRVLDKFQSGVLPGLVPHEPCGLAEIQSGASRYPPRFPSSVMEDD